MSQVTGIDHIAIVVSDLEESLKFYTETLGLKVCHRETINNEGIHVAFIHVGNSTIELMEPYDTNCSMAKRLKRYGQGFVHMCFATEDIKALKENFDDEELFIPGGIRHGAKGEKVMFLHPKDNSGVLTEFVQKETKTSD